MILSQPLLDSKFAGYFTAENIISLRIILYRREMIQARIVCNTPPLLVLLMFAFESPWSDCLQKPCAQRKPKVRSFRNFRLRMPPKKHKSKAPVATKVVGSSRFKTLKVTERISIKNLVEKHKLKFATGRGFYQLTKPETIQFHKEVVVRRKSDGIMTSGDEVQ